MKITSNRLQVAAIAIMAILVPSLTHAAPLTRQLEFGMTGSDVSTLQTFLAQDPVIYPQGLVTGNFRSLTQAAVRSFQARNDIPVVGRVGPITLMVINTQMAGGVATSADVYAPVISSLNASASNTSANISWNTGELSRGVVFYSMNPLATYEFQHTVSVSGDSVMTDSNLRSSQSVSIPNLRPSTTYYYMVQSTDQAGNVSVSWPSTFKTAN